jgi:hypothetical protein
VSPFLPTATTTTTTTTTTTIHPNRNSLLDQTEPNKKQNQNETGLLR